MAEYEDLEYWNMLMALGEARGNPRRAVQIYAETYAQEEDRVPDHRVIENLRERLLGGRTLVPNHNRGQILHVEPYDRHLEDLVLAQVADTPGISTRLIAIRLGLRDNHQLVHRILKDNGLHPYHYRKVQDLRQPRDYEMRQVFCTFMLQLHLQVPNLFELILWSDECIFTPNGLFNSKNFIEWHEQNPFLIKIAKTQFRWTIHVWAGMIGERLVNTILLLKLNVLNYR